MEFFIIGLVFFSSVTFVWVGYLLLFPEENKINDRLNQMRPENEKKKRKKQKTGEKATSQFLEEAKAKLEKRTWIKNLELELQKADLPMKGSEMAMVMVLFSGFGILLGLVVWGFLGLLFGGLIGYLLPMIFIRIKQRKRLALFNQQINDCLTLISNSLKAGFSFFQAVDLVSKEMQAPIAREFGRVLKEINLGASTEEALIDMVERVGSDDLDMVIQAVLIQRQVGGNLAEVLDTISHTIRERIRIQAEIKTLTAQGRMSGVIIGLLPVGLGIMMTMMNPSYFELLWTTTLGKVMIGMAVLLEIIGGLVIQKIVNIRI